mmetsp:Transcript_6166/g.15204  ORF Transcript_6166/g.15204 Transcript_6166/m.15204 type:complete len:177 (+) Transcript_6166:886-1416(+)
MRGWVEIQQIQDPFHRQNVSSHETEVKRKNWEKEENRNRFWRKDISGLSKPERRDGRSCPTIVAFPFRSPPLPTLPPPRTPHVSDVVVLVVLVALDGRLARSVGFSWFSCRLSVCPSDTYRFENVLFGCVLCTPQTTEKHQLPRRGGRRKKENLLHKTGTKGGGPPRAPISCVFQP